MERVIITTLCYHGTDCRVAAWQSNGKISRICLEDPREERLLGSIHVGKVQKILPDIKGAFVEIENRTSCYFPYTKESNFLYTMPKKAPELRAGDELLVQVTREAIKTKAPCVSSNLNFTGKYLVLTTGNRTLGISAKIPSGKREKLKEFLEELMPEDCSYGIILRTNGALASAEELKEELRSLETQFTQLYQKALHTPCYTKLSKGESITASILKNHHIPSPPHPQPLPSYSYILPLIKTLPYNLNHSYILITNSQPYHPQSFNNTYLFSLTFPTFSQLKPLLFNKIKTSSLLN